MTQDRVSNDGGRGAGDLSLLIDGADDVPRHRRRRRRRFFSVVLAMVVIAALVVGVFVGGRALLAVLGDVPDYTGTGTGAITVRVNDGDTASDIATTLVAADVVKSERAFRDAANNEPQSRSIQPGLYQLRGQMQATQALAVLLDPTARLVNAVTIPEGYTVAQILAALAEKTGLPLAEFQAAAADTTHLGLPSWATSLEGFLYPSTYDFDPEATPTKMLQTMVAQFTQATVDLQIDQAAAGLGRTPEEIVIIASMIQSESRIDAERPMIAQVIYNRLALGIPLGIDATSAYELAKPGSELTVTELATPSPYNTRITMGLPPTAISNPGLASLQAALTPTPGPWLYYVLVDAAGNHFFTDDAAAFEVAKAQCQAAGLGCG